jgi:hypothetical protein
VHEGLIAEKSFDGIDAHGFIKTGTVTSTLAGMITDAPHCSRQGIILHDLAPSRFIITLFSITEPGLNVFSGRTGMIARRQTIQVDWAFGSPGSRLIKQAAADI